MMRRISIVALIFFIPTWAYSGKDSPGGQSTYRTGSSSNGTYIPPAQHPGNGGPGMSGGPTIAQWEAQSAEFDRVYNNHLSDLGYSFDPNPSELVTLKNKLIKKKLNLKSVKSAIGDRSYNQKWAQEETQKTEKEIEEISQSIKAIETAARDKGNEVSRQQIEKKKQTRDEFLRQGAEDRKLKEERQAKVLDEVSRLKNPCTGCQDQLCNEKFVSIQAKIFAVQMRNILMTRDSFKSSEDSFQETIRKNQGAHTYIALTAPSPKYVFQSQESAVLGKQYQDLSQLHPAEPARQVARDLGMDATELADHAYLEKDSELGDIYHQLGKEFLDIAVGLDPVTGMGRSAFELITGKNLITGASLSDLERGFAFVNLATLGGTKSIQTLGKALSKFGNVEKIVETGIDLYKKAEKVLPHDAPLKWFKNLEVKTAESTNDFIAKLKGALHPPFKSGTHTAEFITAKEVDFVRVHGPDHIASEWMVFAGEIKGLTAEQIRVKLNLPYTPTHVSNARVMADSTMTRGMTNFNDWGKLDPGKYAPIEKMEGQVQYFLHDLTRAIFENTRPL